MIQIDQPEESVDFTFKIVLVGDMSVGKSCMLTKFLLGKLPKITNPTVGVEYFQKVVTLQDGSKVKAQIWDTAGQERYRSITSNHFRRAVGALLVFDITKEQTFDHLAKWIDDIKQEADPDIVIMIIGNKLDVVEQDTYSRNVSLDRAKKFSEDNKMKFMEVSAVTGQNLSECFESLFQDICKQKSGYRGGDLSQLVLMKQNTNKPTQACKC